MEGVGVSRSEALGLDGCSHACHALIYSDTNTKLFGRIPIRHILLMQMRFDGFLGFSGGLVNLSEESLEAGLSRELSEELGMAIEISEEHHVDAHFGPTPPSSPRLILHFYVKKMEEEELRRVEQLASSGAADHGLEVLGVVRVPLYTLEDGGGLPTFLSHSFVGGARRQLLTALLHFNLVPPQELERALKQAEEVHERSMTDQ